jgi:y4mF family transcriptional regulator
MINQTKTKIISSKGLAQYIKTRRKELKLNQTQLADSANVSRRFIYELESGKPGVRFDKAMNVLLSLSTDVILQGR